MNKQTSKKIAALVLNLFFPGIGTMYGGRMDVGVLQLSIFVCCFVIGVVLNLTLIGALLGIPLIIFGMIGAWIWAQMCSIMIIFSKEKSN